MSMRRAVAGCVVLACLVALLAERTEGHITFFSPKEMMLMKEREGRKDMEPRSEDGHFEVVTVQLPSQVEHVGNTDKGVDISVHIPPNQVAPMLEEIMDEIGEEHQRAK
ncbi:motilin-like isoform X1 [Cheilinus undulatus]|uniref:motilin-like isoform X1 n=1 Tax=Cheilinus undulatus TaxID=241271 RepID=UPI001BD206B8|nr:motilin-like isoform X1 [Cheilinus undulatus]